MCRDAIGARLGVWYSKKDIWVPKHDPYLKTCISGVFIQTCTTGVCIQTCTVAGPNATGKFFLAICIMALSLISLDFINNMRICNKET